MKQKLKYIFLLFSVIILLVSINYSYLDKSLEDFLTEYESAFVERVVDGDTLIANNESVRLLGINSPEKGEKYYLEAKKFLENLTFNKSVNLEKTSEDKDKYGRKLRYIFVEDKNVNLEIVEKGFANYYFPSGKDIYYETFKNAWESCIEQNINLCEKLKDKCAECIELKEFEHKTQEIIFYNKCAFDCEITGWEIKDEGRKKFVFPRLILEREKEIKINIGEGKNNETDLFWKGEDYVWTQTGDTLFLRDKNGKLVLWEGY
ncbi:hypothetical protein COU58_02960 [Candidatus Pacearchaeota archaeon CG10_big_fil_rev_8_21_14_0_10_32_42]|nr:MAG: hypothetical protein COU58_02960 [Candidatus Pacearchaeota archaeon CG10_big_fil_rev_8_21_14_0_10_32_42]